MVLNILNQSKKTTINRLIFIPTTSPYVNAMPKDNATYNEKNEIMRKTKLFSSVPTKLLSFTCIPVCLIRHHLIRHLAQFVSSVYLQEAFCSACSSFADTIQCWRDIHSFVCYCKMQGFKQSQFNRCEISNKQSSYRINSLQGNLHAATQMDEVRDAF